MEKLNALKKYFGYIAFRTGQEELTDNILGGRDTLGIMPTGAGKSIYVISSEIADIVIEFLKNNWLW